MVVLAVVITLPAAAALPAFADANAGIEARCSAQFATDRATRALCIGEGREAYGFVAAAWPKADAVLQAGIDTCVRDHAAKHGWPLAGFCVRERARALEQLK